jgi:hypothetical protein
MWNNFTAIYGDGSVASVGKKIGGKVGENFELGIKDPNNGFTNACAVRMSYSFNYSGAPVERGTWSTVSGGDKKWYIYRVRDLLAYLKYNFGKPDKTVKSPKASDFSGLKGILVFSVAIWTDASGHATLWNGSTCSDHCYFPVATEASLWLLK